MSGNVKTQVGKIIGKTLNSYYPRVKSTIDDLKFKQEYQDRIIECMVGEVDDNYITTPETDNPIVKLEHSKEGLVKVPTVKGKTILVDAEGNETDTPAEGCRLLSVGEQEDNKLIILSKNYNFELGTFGNSIDVKYSPKSATNRIRTENLIDVNPNNTYIVTCSKGYEISTGMFDKNNICKQNHPRTQMKLIIKPNADIVKMGVIVRKIDNSDLTVDDILKANIQIEGDLKHHKTEILLSEPLRSLPNGTCDELVGNKLIRRLREVTLRGDETIGIFKEKDEHISFRFEYKNFPNSVRGSENLVLSNNFKWLLDFSRNEELINFAGAIVIITISKSKLKTPDIEGFKKWLKLNPTSIIYPLSEPIIEELSNGITTQGFDDTTMYIENSITPTVSYGYNALIPYKEELSQQKEEVEVNTLDIENNIIPYLMDMEFNLMLMEDEE